MNITELHRSVFNFRLSLVLLFFIRLGLFELLKSDWMTIGQVEQALRLKAGRVQAVFDMLLAHGLVIQREEAYRLPDHLMHAFSEGHSESIQNLLTFDFCNVHKWAHLERTFFDDGAFCLEPLSVFDVFERAMQERVGDMQERIAQLVLRHMKGSVADIGCGPGVAVEAVLRREAQARCYLVDIDSVIKATAARFERVLGERATISFVPADVLNEPIPVEASVVLASRLLMGYGGDRLETVIEKLVAVVEPDGMLIVNEFDPQTRIGSLMSLDMVVNASTMIHRQEEYARLLKRYGMTLTERVPTSAFTHALCFSHEAAR